MPLLKRIFADKRRVLVPLAVILAANAAVFAFAVYPLRQRQAGVEVRADAAAKARQEAEQDLAAARALVEGKARAKEELATFYDKVLPADLTAARRMTYATLPALARKTNVSWSERRTDVDQAQSPDNRLGHLQIRMQLEGDYESIREFVYELENAPEFIIIDDVTLAQNDSAMPLTLSVQLSAYYRLENNGS
jgi:Tfp pilus assembly protein PilO